MKIRTDYFDRILSPYSCSYRENGGRGKYRDSSSEVKLSEAALRTPQPASPSALLASCFSLKYNAETSPISSSFKRRSSPISSNAKRKKPNKQPTPQFYDPISRGMKQNEAIAATSFSPPMLPPPPLSPPPLLKKRLRPPTLRTRPSVQPSCKQILVPQIKGLVCLKLDNSEGDNVYFLMKQVFEILFADRARSSIRLRMDFLGITNCELADYNLCCMLKQMGCLKLHTGTIKLIHSLDVIRLILSLQIQSRFTTGIGKVSKETFKTKHLIQINNNLQSILKQNDAKDCFEAAKLLINEM